MKITLEYRRCELITTPYPKDTPQIPINCISEQESTQRAQTSADPEDPDFGLWTPGSEA